MKRKWFKKTLAIALSAAMMCTPMMAAASVERGGGEPNSEFAIEQNLTEETIFYEGENEKPPGAFTEQEENLISEESNNLEEILPEENAAKASGNEEEEISDYDIWMAQTMLNGIGGSGMSYYV